MTARSGRATMAMRSTPRHAAAARRKRGATGPRSPDATMAAAGQRSDAAVATPHKVKARQAPPQPATSAASGAARPSDSRRPTPTNIDAATRTPAHAARSAQLGVSNSMAVMKDAASGGLSGPLGAVKARGVGHDPEEGETRRGEHALELGLGREREGMAADQGDIVVAAQSGPLAVVERRRGLAGPGPQALGRETGGERAIGRAQRHRLLRRGGEERRHAGVAPNEGERRAGARRPAPR